MKKPLLGTIGVVGACAACCAIPLAVPLLGGASLATALAAVEWNLWRLGTELAIVLLVVGTGLLAWTWRRRAAARRAGACATAETAAGPACSVGPAGGGCGCGSSGARALTPALSQREREFSSTCRADF